MFHINQQNYLLFSLIPLEERVYFTKLLPVELLVDLDDQGLVLLIATLGGAVFFSRLGMGLRLSDVLLVAWRWPRAPRSRRLCAGPAMQQ